MRLLIKRGTENTKVIRVIGKYGLGSGDYSTKPPIYALNTKWHIDILCQSNIVPNHQRHSVDLTSEDICICRNGKKIKSLLFIHYLQERLKMLRDEQGQARSEKDSIGEERKKVDDGLTALNKQARPRGRCQRQTNIRHQ